MTPKKDLWLKVAIGFSALLLGVAFGHWSATSAPRTTDPRAFAPATAPNDSAFAKKGPIPRPRSPEKLVKASAAAQPERLAEILKERSGSDRLRDITGFIERLAPGEFAAALLAANKLPQGPDRDLAKSLLVARWAELDPEAALNFAASHKEFSEVTGAVFKQLATNDLQAALTRAQAISDPAVQYQALRGALGVMAQNDPAGALKLAAGAVSLPRTESLSQMIYQQWSETDPAAAAAAAAQDTTAEGWRSPLGQVVRNWANQDPQAALSFAMTMGDPEAQGRSVGDIVRRWSERDAGEAAGWINSMPAGSVRDAAAAALASSVATTDVSTAVGWAQSISDAEARTAALQRLSRRVIWQDPANGPAALANAGVPAEILQNLPQRRGH